MAEEKILIDVQVKADQLAKTQTEIDKLKARNKELSKSYKENSTEIETNKAKLKNLQQEQRREQKELQLLTKEVTKEGGAYERLALEYGVVSKRAKDLSAQYGVNSKQAKQANKEAKALGDQLKGVDAAVGQNQRSVGDYGSALGSLSPALGRIVTGFGAMTKAALTFIATPIGAVIAALVFVLASLKAAFTSSEEGQDKWNKIMTVGSAILGNLVDLLADFGEKVIEAFENPQKAIKDFADLIKENISNRFEGLTELLPQLGKAINLLFKGEFSEAGKVATNAVAKVTLGVEDITDKIDGAIDATQRFIKEQEKEAASAARVADMRAKADRIDRKLKVDGARLESEIAELRLKARQEEEFTAEQRKVFLEDAKRLNDELLDQQIQSADLRFRAQKLENTFSRTNKENKDKEADAEAALFAVQTRRFNFGRELERENKRINGQIKKQKEDEIKAEKELLKTLAETKTKVIQLAESQTEREKRLVKEKYAEIEKDLIESNEKVKVEERLTAEEIALLKVQIEKKKAEEIAAIKQKEVDAEKKAEEEKAQAVKDANTKKIDSAKNYADKAIGALSAINDFANALDAREIQNAEVKSNRELEILNNQLEEGLITEEVYNARKSKNEQKLEKEKARIARDSAKREKALNIFQATINTSTAIIKALADPGGIAGTVLSVLAGITGAAQIAAISATPLPKASRGTILKGKSHAQGGIPIEAEGGEAIINKRSTSMFTPLLSAINEAGGGVKFARGGIPDGGFAGRSSISSGLDMGTEVARALGNIKFAVAVEDINRGQGQYAQIQQGGRI